jgi:hypothetical protein
VDQRPPHARIRKPSLDTSLTDHRIELSFLWPQLLLQQLTKRVLESALEGEIAGGRGEREPDEVGSGR